MNRPPELKIVAGGGSPEETAAVVAALEQFMRATGPKQADDGPPAADADTSGWLAAALAEGVARHPDVSPGPGRPVSPQALGW